MSNYRVCTGPCGLKKETNKKSFYWSERDNNWYAICILCFRDRDNKTSKIKRLETKKQAINICGGVCGCCVENILDFLTIDHINGGGRAEGLSSMDMHKAIFNGARDAKDLRSLCYNCNCSRGMYGFCPHEFADISDKNNCFVCGNILIERIIGKKNPKTNNYHPLFKRSGINICLGCSLKPGAKGNYSLENRSTRLSLKTKVINGYGGKCECCDEPNYMFLTIDHINGHMGVEKQNPRALYLQLARNNFPRDNFRLLCYNCNCGRGHNGSDGICPHKKENVIRLIPNSINNISANILTF
jgi:hypothetical protein